MDMNAEDFDLCYAFRVGWEEGGRLRQEFERAQAGSKEDAMYFAFHVLEVASTDPRPEVVALIPGVTPEANEKALRASISILNELSEEGNIGAKRKLKDLQDMGVDTHTEQQAEAVSPPVARSSQRGKFSL